MTPALSAALEAIESNLEKLSTLIERYGRTRPTEKEARETQQPMSASGLSITEFIKKVGRDRGTDIALAIAYYLLKERNVDTINTKDLNNAYDEARLTKPKNVTDTLNSLVELGKMKSASSKDSLKGFAITQTGEKEVQEWVSGRASP